MKLFKDLNIGDIVFKVHYDFEHNNSEIETKIIKEIKEPFSEFDKKHCITFIFEGGSSLLDWVSYAKLDLDKDHQQYFECHQLMVSSNEIADGEYVYYTTDKHTALRIFKSELEKYTNKLSYQKKDIDKKLKKFRKYCKKFEQIN
mgnify:CR=1 FL=1